MHKPIFQIIIKKCGGEKLWYKDYIYSTFYAVNAIMFGKENYLIINNPNIINCYVNIEDAVILEMVTKVPINVEDLE